MTSSTVDPEAPPLRFASYELARVAAVSARQLQWWDEQKIVSPEHRWNRRLYSAEDALLILIIADLRRKGCSLQQLRALFSSHALRLRRALDSYELTEQLYLVTDGKSFSLEADLSDTIKVVEQSAAGLWLVSIDSHVLTLQRYVSGRQRSGVPLWRDLFPSRRNLRQLFRHSTFTKALEGNR